MPITRGIHHAAYRCRDAQETVEFYKRALDMDLMLAISEDRVPSTKAPDPYMHIFLDAGRGNVLAFFEIPNSPPMGRDTNTPPWVQHIALKVGGVDELLAAKARLQGEVDKKKKDFEAEQGKLRDDKAVLDKQGAMMSEEVRTQKFTEWQKRLYEVMQKAQKVQVDLQDKERTELKKIFEKMDPIIAAIAQREGLTMVFEKTDSGLVYAPPSLDLTNELVRTYNEKYPAKVSAAAQGTKAAVAPKPGPVAAPAAPKDAPKQ